MSKEFNHPKVSEFYEWAGKNLVGGDTLTVNKIEHPSNNILRLKRERKVNGKHASFVFIAKGEHNEGKDIRDDG